MELTVLTPLIGRALEVLRPVVHGIEATAWSRSTPCPEWDVWEVLNHTVGGMRIFTAELTGAGPVADHASDWLGGDPVQAFEDAAAGDLAAWGGPLAPERTVTIGLGTLPLTLAAVVHLTELVAHGVDLAVATDQARLLDEDLCANLLGAMHAMGGVDAYRVPGVFGPAVPTPSGARPHDQLAAYLGRRPTRAEQRVAGIGA